MDTPTHQSLYAQGYEMRKKVVGEDYVEKALEKGSSDFMRPLQQFATVCPFIIPHVLQLLPHFWTLNGKKNKGLIQLGECLGDDLDSPWIVIERQESAKSGHVDGIGQVD